MKQTLQKCLKYLCQEEPYRMLRDWTYEMEMEALHEQASQPEFTDAERNTENDIIDLQNTADEVISNLSQEIQQQKKTKRKRRNVKKNEVILSIICRPLVLILASVITTGKKLICVYSVRFRRLSRLKILVYFLSPLSILQVKGHLKTAQMKAVHLVLLRLLPHYIFTLIPMIFMEEEKKKAMRKGYDKEKTTKRVIQNKAEKTTAEKMTVDKMTVDKMTAEEKTKCQMRNKWLKKEVAQMNQKS